MSRCAILLVATLLHACGERELEPEGHVLVSVTTDAVLPAPPGAMPASGAPLFDRLRIELFAPGESAPCAGCTREIAADTDSLDTASFTVGSHAGRQGVRVRLRLYRSGGTASGDPRTASTIETVAVLPRIPDEGAIERQIVLRTDDVARPRGSLQAPIEAEPGRAPRGLVGSFWGARSAGCAGQAGSGELCVPGGAFWMGNPRLDLGAIPELDGAAEHLVVLSPFWLDAAELSVARFRASGLAIPALDGTSDNPHEAGGKIPHCTYTSAASENDEHPVNCVSWHQAAAFCESAGKRLPTEAELEYVGSALGHFPYVWGTDPPACGDAVFERGQPSDACGQTGTGPMTAGSASRDRLALGSSDLVDLAGNVREWTLDLWNRDHEPCWTEPLLENPSCQSPSPSNGPARSTRGGDFDSPGVLLQASVRAWLANETHAVSALIGFRCARDADPAAASR
jgi:formylglycine-generating enzyme